MKSESENEKRGKYVNNQAYLWPSRNLLTLLAASAFFFSLPFSLVQCQVRTHGLAAAIHTEGDD